jgi:hypothetical protein
LIVNARNELLSFLTNFGTDMRAISLIVIVLMQSQKLISHFDVTYIIESFKWVNCLRKKLKFQCPCGYDFEIFGIANDAISMVKLHVESFHKNYLPFGITNDEAQTLLNGEHEKIKPKISKRTAYSVQTEPAYSFKNTTSTSQSLLDKILGEDIEVEYRRTERKKAQLIA